MDEKNEKIQYFYVRDYLACIFGENPGQATLCGSNIFLVGNKNSNERIMIDCADLPENNAGFLKNLNKYFDDIKNKDVYVSKIFLTHGHHDHIGGLQDVLELFKKRG